MTLSDTPAKQRQQEWQTHLKPMQSDLRANRCPPHVLSSLAVAYYGGYRDVEGDTPRERLENLLGEDEDLVEAVLQAFQTSISREDLPGIDEVIRLGTNHETHFLSYPYMAGLHEISETSRDKSPLIGEAQWRLALAIYYTVPLWPLPLRVGDDTPPWFPSLLRSRPDLVAEMLVKTTRRKLRSPSDFVGGLYELAHSPDCKAVARMAALPLLKAFPVRCPRQRLQDLNYLLMAAVLHGEKATLLDLITQKLSSQTMHVGQRVRWLAAGLFVAPDPYQALLESYVSGHEPRIRALAEITTRRFLEALLDSPGVSVLSLLIRLLGSSYGPHYYDENDPSVKGCLIRRDTDTALSIRFLCEQLAKVPTPEATESLESLRTEELLRAWHLLLADLADQQRIRRREKPME